MALLPVNLYSDWKCTQAGQAIVPGVAAATGWAADPTHWGSITPSEYSEAKIYFTDARTVANNNGAFTLSGGNAIYNNAVAGSIPWGDNIETDKEMNGSSNTVDNPFFTSFDAENSIAYWLSIAAYNPTNDKPQQYVLRFGYYNQEPEDATGSDRTSWRYWKFNNNAFGELFYPGGVPTYFPSEFSQVKVYKLTLGEVECFLFAFGVSADNRYNVQQAVSFGTNFIAIPTEFFKDKESRPWVGDESEPDEETGFYPNNEPSDQITPRTDYDDNPYMIGAAGSGIKVIFPAKVENEYQGLIGDILSGIYQGSNEGFINRAEQLWAELVNGNTNRAWSEIQAIMNGILLYHSVPLIKTTYSANYKLFRTICGYNIINEGKWVEQANKSIFEAVYSSETINPRLNCFLDYEPYTSMILKLPFCPAISVSPSAIYGHYVRAIYKIDIVTGILHCDVSILGGSKNYIIHSCEANVKTDIPIMGQGANAGGLEKITGAVLGAMSGNVGAGVSGIVGTLDAVAGKSHGEAVGMMSTDGIGAYLAARSAYLIVTYPKAAIPTQEEDGAPVGGFLWQQGMASATAEKISYYAGGFAKFSSVDLSRVQATQAEKEDIIARLKEGVYL